MTDTTTTQDRMVEYDGCGETLRVYESGKIERYHDRWNKWKVVKMTRDPDRGYCRIGVNKKGFRAHRVIYAAFNEDFDINDETILVEHIKGFDNNLSNLRQASSKTTDNKSQKGYYYIKSKDKWQVQISLGMFEKEEEAKEFADATKDVLGLNDCRGLQDRYEQLLGDFGRVTKELEALKAKEPEPYETVYERAREDFVSDWVQASIRASNRD